MPLVTAKAMQKERAALAKQLKETAEDMQTTYDNSPENYMSIYVDRLRKFAAALDSQSTEAAQK